MAEPNGKRLKWTVASGAALALMAGLFALLKFGGIAWAGNELSNKFTTKDETNQIVAINNANEQRNSMEHENFENRITQNEQTLKTVEQVKARQSEIERKVDVAVNQQQNNTARLTRIEDKLDRLLEKQN